MYIFVAEKNRKGTRAPFKTMGKWANQKSKTGPKFGHQITDLDAFLWLWRVGKSVVFWAQNFSIVKNQVK